jgi:hypothetical protein
MKDFFDWHHATRRPPLNEVTVQRYAAEPREQGVRASSITQRLGAICKLAREEANSKALPEPVASGFKAVQVARRERRRAENWLTGELAQQLINAPIRCVSKSGGESVRPLGLPDPSTHLICLPKVCSWRKAQPLVNPKGLFPTEHRSQGTCISSDALPVAPLSSVTVKVAE